MRRDVLFGGALMAAGVMLASETAIGQVVDVGFSAALSVNDRLAYDPYTFSYTFVDNQSYTLSGDINDLPFSGSIIGGTTGGVFPSNNAVSVDLDASVQPDGGLTASGRGRASFEIYDGSDADFGVNGTAQLSFTLLQPAEFELTLWHSFDNDTGSSSASLRRVDAVGLSISADPFQVQTFSGVLEPGTYLLSGSGAGNGEGTFDITIFEPIPTPFSASLFVVAGVAALRPKRA